MLQHWRQPALFAFTMTGRAPCRQPQPIPHALRSVAHEPMEEPRGSHVAVRAGECVMAITQKRDSHHAHTGSVPGVATTAT